MTSALLIIDIQNDYFPGGANPLAGSDAAVNNARRMLAAFREDGAPIIHIRHESIREGATFFLPGTIGAEFHASVAPLEGEMVMTKHFPNAFRDTALLEFLRTAAVSRLAIAGMMTHMCVDASVRAAADYGFAVALAHDACATKELAFNGARIPAELVQSSFLAALAALVSVLPAAEIPGIILV